MDNIWGAVRNATCHGHGELMSQIKLSWIRLEAFAVLDLLSLFLCLWLFTLYLFL
jgi:hypothetical protein